MTLVSLPIDAHFADESDTHADLSAAPLNSALLQAVPEPVRPSLADLRKALAQQRVVVVRLSTGLSWEFIFSTATSILFHLAVIAALVLVAYFTPVVVSRMGYSGTANEGGKGKGVVGGFVIGPGEPRPGVAPAPVPPAPAAPQKELVVPPIPAPALPPAQNVQALQEKLANPEAVGLAAKAATSQPALPQIASVPPPLTFAPPTAAAAATPAKPVAAGNAGPRDKIGGGGAGGSGRGGSRLGQGPGVGEEDEEGYDLMKSGNGSGKGEGKNRGPSGADKQIQILESTPFVSVQNQLSGKQIARIAGKRIYLDIQVKANGSVGSVKIIESCGDSEIDAMFVSAAYKLTFMPAMRGGRAIEDTIQVSQQF